MWRVGELSVAEILQFVRSGRLALPQFQRDEVWGKGDWLPFLRTLLLKRPTGTLLLLEASDNRALAPRALETAPALAEKVEWLLLDGQQRTTTLFRATHTAFGKSPAKRVVVRVKEALECGELLEEHLELRKQADVTDYVSLARTGEIDFLTLADDVKRESWRYEFIKRHYASTGDQPAERFASDILRVVPGLMAVNEYVFPILSVKDDTPLSVVAEIFEGMNRRGQQLSTFDLMVARLYQPVNPAKPSGARFNLRERWEEALEDSPNLRQLGVRSDSGMLPLQLIAQQVSRNHGIRGRVTGLNASDVLELKPAQVIGSTDAEIGGLDLQTAVKALDMAAEVLITRCGVVAPNLLPQQAMLLPLADQMLRARDERLDPPQLMKWFFAVGLSGEYYGSVNSYAATHCEELTNWANTQREPTRVAELSKKFIEGLNLRAEFRRDGSILGKTIMSFVVQIGAYDWNNTQSNLVRHCDPIEFHHIVPEARLKALKFAKSEQRPIAGLTPVSKSANARIRKENPKTVITDMGNHARPIMASHLIDPDAAKIAYDSKAKYDRFCLDREKQIKKRLIEFLGL